MERNSEYKPSYCKVCNAKLPVPTWKLCQLHAPHCTVSKEPVNELKPPDLDTQLTKRERYMPKIVLDTKIKPFKYYMGYEIKIPFLNFVKAKTILRDDDTWSIIGYSFE